VLTIHRRHPARNMARFYVVSLQADWLGGWAVAREWGRIAGQSGCASIGTGNWNGREMLPRALRPGSVVAATVSAGVSEFLCARRLKSSLVSPLPDK
jgi:hypothetical protein